MLEAEPGVAAARVNLTLKRVAVTAEDTPGAETRLIAALAGRGYEARPLDSAALEATRVDAEGRVVVSTYPERAKVANLRRNPTASLMSVGADFGDAWVQVDGAAEVIDLPEAVEPLVDYFRAISGEHPDWDEYRAAMVTQGKSLIRLTIERWGPIATGGFPARLA